METIENNDKTMEVVVTVELIKTPVTESESISDVVLTLSAGPKGANHGSFVSTPVDDERLDNVWPLEWNTFDVMENTSFEDGFLVRISRLAPSLSELQSAQLYASLDGETISGHFFDYMQEGNAILNKNFDVVFQYVLEFAKKFFFCNLENILL